MSAIKDSHTWVSQVPGSSYCERCGDRRAVRMCPGFPQHPEYEDVLAFERNTEILRRNVFYAYHSSTSDEETVNALKAAVTCVQNLYARIENLDARVRELEKIENLGPRVEELEKQVRGLNSSRWFENGR